MNRIFTCILFSCLFLFGTNVLVFGQKCKTNQIRQQNMENNPEIRNEINRINAFTERWIREESQSMGRRSVETLPVVVHVLWRTATENISEEQVLSQMEVLNEDFRLLNDNFGDTPSPFAGVAADVEIEFCLAAYDPNGNPTNGITRTQTDVNDIGATNSWFVDEEGGKSAWDIDRYINIWVCDLGDDGTLGFATPPGTAYPPESDGMVIDHRYFGTTGTATASFPNHLGRTVTHEMGHYFNLEHVWGAYDGGCSDDDMVADTPNQEYDSSGCPSFPSFDACTASGNGIMFNNYMDYSDDDCMTMFTEGQKSRMLAALNGPRADLLDGGVCETFVGTTEQYAFEKAVRLFPNPVVSRLQIAVSGTLSARDTEFRLTDISGKEIVRTVIGGSGEIDVSSLSAGMYFLTCNAFPGAVQKVIITK